MVVKRSQFTRTPAGLLVLPRRDVLRGLGALAVASPALAAIGCSGDDPKTAGGLNGTGGTAGSTPAGSGASGAGVAGSGVSSGSAGSGTAGASVSGTAGQAGSPAAGSGAAGSSSVAGRGSAGVSGATNVGGAPGAAGTLAASGGSGGSSAGSAGSSAMLPAFPDSGTCLLTTTDIEGPFYIDEMEVMDDVSMVRSDIRDGHVGVEFRLHFRLMDARKSCAPIPDAELYIWHCDADGLYSGFSGQDPSKPYMGSANPSPSNLDRFCRGIQSSDAMGIASFTSVYPGWYAGRPLHVHLMARIKGATTRLITTQLYFPADFTVDVHSTEPAYMARAASIPAGSKNPPSGKPAMPAMTHTPGLVVGTLNVIVNG
jgi:protocatechuate 3,4-dioxygenase beta subunit